MGRKRTHTDATRTRIVSARLKPETYDLISEHADKLGLSRAGYIEHLIENRPLRLARPLADEMSVPLLNELKRIGNNLNQIAHARNSGLDVDPRQFRTVVTQIIATICSNEVTRRRYEAAKAEVAGPRGQVIEEELPLRKDTRPNESLAPRNVEPPENTPPAPAPTTEHVGRPGQQPQPLRTRASTVQEGASEAAPSPLGNDLGSRKPDFDLRLSPSDALIAPTQTAAAGSNNKRSQNSPGRKHDPKTSSSWFKLPWGLRLHSSRRR